MGWLYVWRCVRYRFLADCGDDNSRTTPAWGFRFHVTPLCGEWRNETQVLREPSLEWACWVMNFLLNNDVTIPPRSGCPVETNGSTTRMHPSHSPLHNSAMYVPPPVCSVCTERACTERACTLPSPCLRAVGERVHAASNVS